MPTIADVNSPAWRDPQFARWEAARARCRDVLDGTDAVQENAPTYLPKLPRETVQNYQLRRKLAEVVNLFAGAMRAAEGLMIAEPPALVEGVPARLVPLWQDIDGNGLGGAAWLRGVLRAMLGQGFTLALVSTPVRAGQPITQADEQQQRLRPYVSMYHADDVLSARMVRDGGRLVLAQLVLREQVHEPDGLFGMTQITQFRVLQRLGAGNHTSQVYRANDRGEPLPFGPVESIQTQEIPVVEFQSMPTEGFAKSPPPLLELADLTLSHWRVLTDRRWALKQACYPWLVRIGYQDDGATTAGPTEVLDLPMGADAKWIAPPPEAMQPTRDELNDIERRAAQLSLSFLSGESSQGGSQQTATAAQIDQQGQDASLAGIAVSVRDNLNRLFALFAEMMGEVPQDEYFTVQTTFRGLRRDPMFLRVVLDTWKEGGLPMSAMLHALQHGELPDDFDIEQAALEAMAEAEVARSADAEQLRLQAETLDAAPVA